MFSRSLLKFMSIELVIPSNHLILCHPLLLPSIFPSIRVFSNESAVRITWPKCWSFSFSFSISPCNEHSGLISFRMDWLDLLAVQGTLKSLLQHHSSKASVLRRSFSDCRYRKCPTVQHTFHHPMFLTVLQSPIPGFTLMVNWFTVHSPSRTTVA